MSGEFDSQLAEAVIRLEVLDQETLDRGIAIQKGIEAKGNPATLAAVLVAEGFLPYDLLERILAQLEELIQGMCKGWRGSEETAHNMYMRVKTLQQENHELNTELAEEAGMTKESHPDLFKVFEATKQYHDKFFSDAIADLDPDDS